MRDDAAQHRYLHTWQACVFFADWTFHKRTDKQLHSFVMLINVEEGMLNEL